MFLRPFGDVAAHDALGQAFDDGGLADARLADEHRVVLGAAREDLDDAADLLVAADDRVELALRGQLGEVAAVALQGLVGAFRGGGGDALAAADLLEGLHEALAGEAELFEQAAGGAAVAGHGQEQVLDRDVLVLEAAGLVFGLHQEAVEAAGDGSVVRRPRGASYLRQAREFLLEPLPQAADGGLRLVQNGGGQPALLLQQSRQQVFHIHLLMAEADGLGLSGL